MLRFDQQIQVLWMLWTLSWFSLLSWTNIRTFVLVIVLDITYFCHWSYQSLLSFCFTVMNISVLISVGCVDRLFDLILRLLIMTTVGWVTAGTSGLYDIKSCFKSSWKFTYLSDHKWIFGTDRAGVTIEKLSHWTKIDSIVINYYYYYSSSSGGGSHSHSHSSSIYCVLLYVLQVGTSMMLSLSLFLRHLKEVNSSHVLVP